MKTNRGTLFITCFLLTSISFAQHSDNENRGRPKPPPPIDKIFTDLDLDKDNKISFQEAKGPLKRDFSKIDANEDGFVTRKELEKAPKPERPDNNNRE